MVAGHHAIATSDPHAPNSQSLRLPYDLSLYFFDYWAGLDHPSPVDLTYIYFDIGVDYTRLYLLNHMASLGTRCWGDITFPHHFSVISFACVRYLKALVWFWWIDETLSANLVYQSNHEICSTIPSGGANEDHDDGGDGHGDQVLGLEKKKEKRAQGKGEIDRSFSI